MLALFQFLSTSFVRGCSYMIGVSYVLKRVTVIFVLGFRVTVTRTPVHHTYLRILFYLSILNTDSICTVPIKKIM